MRPTDTGNGWDAWNGDSVEVVGGMDSDSVHFSVFSPPFAQLYTYSDDVRDMGNCRNHTEFYEHFRFLASDLYRVTMPGRILAFHCMLLPTKKSIDGFIGLYDFRGDMIRLFSDVGFIFHGETCIWKDPVTQMQRTKALGLLHKQIRKDSTMSRPGLADYLIAMRKPGDNPEPVSHTHETFPVSRWQRHASPVWNDIDMGDTLQYTAARDEKDERHICPLQLGVVRRAVNLWSNPGDTVLTPFGGIGTEGYVALEMGRKARLVELKESYYKVALQNLRSIESGSLHGQMDLLNGVA